MRRNGHKFNAQRTVIDGITFASKAEAKRYQELKLLEKAGEIHGLVLQPSYPCEVLGVESRPIGVYKADFAYCMCTRFKGACERAHEIVEDVKGFKTELYRWKKRHVEMQYGITITEITSR